MTGISQTSQETAPNYTAAEGRTVSEVIINITEWAEQSESIDAVEIARLLAGVLDMVARRLDRETILRWVDEETEM